jgi:spore germination cell wall hydrolase CwlJ-like protein
VIVAVALILIALIAATLLANVNRTPKPFIIHQAPGAREEPRVSDIAVPNLVEPVTAGEAIQQNQKRPFDALPDTPAQPFVLHADDESRERAITCLAQAAYYEAGAEGEDGERAVVQVVLNRLRRPGFPSTLCGVVYQGSELPTGCQFTFTCNGSLDREPSPAGWRQARQIAVAALDGKVFAGIGHATHFHADYVLPYWADSFAKQVQIGTHIFYRLKGALGSSAAFSQRYGGSEPAIRTPGQINPLIQSPIQGGGIDEYRGPGHARDRRGSSGRGFGRRKYSRLTCRPAERVIDRRPRLNADPAHSRAEVRKLCWFREQADQAGGSEESSTGPFGYSMLRRERTDSFTARRWQSAKHIWALGMPATDVHYARTFWVGGGFAELISISSTADSARRIAESQLFDES